MQFQTQSQTEFDRDVAFILTTLTQEEQLKHLRLATAFDKSLDGVSTHFCDIYPLISAWVIEEHGINIDDALGALQGNRAEEKKLFQILAWFCIWKIRPNNEVQVAAVVVEVEQEQEQEQEEQVAVVEAEQEQGDQDDIFDDPNFVAIDMEAQEQGDQDDIFDDPNFVAIDMEAHEEQEEQKVQEKQKQEQNQLKRKSIESDDHMPLKKRRLEEFGNNGNSSSNSSSKWFNISWFGTSCLSFRWWCRASD